MEDCRMVQMLSTVMVRILPPDGPGGGQAGNPMVVEVRTCMDDGEKKMGCQVTVGGKGDGTYLLGVKTGIQAMILPAVGATTANQVRPYVKGSRIDRYA